MGRVDPINFEERKVIEELLQLDYSGSQIAYEINRHKNSINFEIRRNGGRKNYKAEIAQQRHNDIGMLKNSSLREKYDKGKHPISRMKQKIENLEMQMEILTDSIKELRKIYESNEN